MNWMDLNVHRRFLRGRCFLCSPFAFEFVLWAKGFAGPLRVNSHIAATE
jgi:hypothetical protein